MANGGKAGKDYIEALKQEVAQLERDKDAIREEFTHVMNEEWSPEKLREMIRKELIPAAWISLKDMLMNAESEGIKSSLIKWVFDKYLEPAKAGEEDPDADMKTLLAALGANDK